MSRVIARVLPTGLGQQLKADSHPPFRHTVEELQQFSNTRTPSPPWVRVLRVVVPMSCCDQAADYLIDALGGEAVTKRVVGGTKWWQVRGINGCGITSDCSREELIHWYPVSMGNGLWPRRIGKKPRSVQNPRNAERRKERSPLNSLPLPILPLRMTLPSPATPQKWMSRDVFFTCMAVSSYSDSTHA